MMQSCPEPGTTKAQREGQEAPGYDCGYASLITTVQAADRMRRQGEEGDVLRRPGVRDGVIDIA